MIEMRWVEYDVPTQQTCYGYIKWKTQKKLQYRWQKNNTMHEFNPEDRWTNWIDVPKIVAEETIGCRQRRVNGEDL